MLELVNAGSRKRFNFTVMNNSHNELAWRAFNRKSFSRSQQSPDQTSLTRLPPVERPTLSILRSPFNVLQRRRTEPLQCLVYISDAVTC